VETAAFVAGGQDFPRGCLYVVATPIGNLADIGLRALHALALADLVACEDTRTSGALLRHFGLEKPLLALHEHNERSAAQQVCTRLAAGERIAYVSDAGTPAVSDPGAALVQVVTAAGHRVMPLPGASSAIAALSVAGDASARGFRVVGFVSSKAQERAAGIAGWRDDDLAFVKDWGFRPADITVPVSVWQGEQDRMVPFAHGQWLADAIPGARAHLHPDEGHISLASQAGSILTDLLDQARSAQRAD